VYASLSTWSKAIEFVRVSIKSLEEIFGVMSVEVGREHFKLAQLYQASGNFREGLRHAKLCLRFVEPYEFTLGLESAGVRSSDFFIQVKKLHEELKSNTQALSYKH
jgi:hypothetical protein